MRQTGGRQIDGLRRARGENDLAVCASAEEALHGIPRRLKGGGGAGLDLTYGLEYGHFLFETGLDFRFLNSTSAYGFQATRTEQTYGATYTYLFDNLRETRNMLEFGNFANSGVNMITSNLFTP